MSKFIKKRPLFLNLQDFKIMHLILTEREIEDREDELTPQTREIDLRVKVGRIISNIERARAFEARRAVSLGITGPLVVDRGDEQLRSEQLGGTDAISQD